MWNQKASFRFEINNFSEKKATTFSSPTFVSGGCEWYVRVYSNDHHLTLGLHVANHELLQSGWKTSADFCFVVLNQSDKELFRSTIGKIPENNFFCAKTPCWGFKETLPLSKFKETESLDKDTLIIDVYIKILQVVDGEGKDVLVENNIVDVNGFQVLASQVTLVRKLFAEHPGFAEDFKPYNQAVKTSYMNVLMKLIKRLEKPIKSLSETRLRKAQNELSDLMSVGFKLNWLKLKLEEVTLEKKVYDNESKVNLLEERVKGLETMESSHMMERLQANLEYVLSEKEKASVDESRVQEIDERVKNLELMELDLKLVSLKTKLDEVYLERKKLDDDYEVRAKQLEESVKNLELVYSLKTNLDDGESRVQELDERNLGLMDLGVKLDSLKKRFEELSLEVEELHDVDDDDDDDDDDEDDDDDDDDSRVQELEERVNDLEMMDLEDRLDSLTKKLDEVSSEMMELHDDDDDDSRVQELEDRVNSLEMMDLGHKLDSLNTKLEKVSVERKKLDDDNAARAQELDGRVNDLELMDLGVKLDSLNTKLEKASVERKKLDDANAARAQGLYERFDDLDKEFEFKLESLEKKIEKASVERKELDDENESRFEELEDRVNGHELVCSKLDSLNTKHESRAQGLEERIKGLELMDLGPKVDSLKTKVFGVILGIKKLDVANKSRVQELEGRVSDQELGFSELDSLNTELEERVKSLELMDLGVKLDSLKTKLEEVTLERKKQDDDNASRVRELEERVNGLELVDLGFRQVCLNKVLEEAALERKKSDEANAVRFKRLEEMVLQLKDELDKKKDKSSADGFLLVD